MKLTADQHKDSMSRLMYALGIRTQLELAERLGVRQGSISGAARQSSIPDTWLVRLLLDLGLSPAWVLYGSGSTYLGPTDAAAPLVAEPREPTPEPAKITPAMLVRQLQGMLPGAEVHVVWPAPDGAPSRSRPHPPEVEHTEIPAPTEPKIEPTNFNLDNPLG